PPLEVSYSLGPQVITGSARSIPKQAENSGLQNWNMPRLLYPSLTRGGTGSNMSLLSLLAAAGEITRRSSPLLSRSAQYDFDNNSRVPGNYSWRRSGDFRVS